VHKNITLAVFAAFLLCACAHRPPPIGRGGPRAATEVTSWFDTRVKQRFPVGSEEEKLRAELHREAFRIDEANDPAARYRFTASYQANGLACTVRWHIRWNSEQGRITDVAAEWGQTCL
jgi:hypothetical protein